MTKDFFLEKHLRFCFNYIFWLSYLYSLLLLQLHILIMKSVSENSAKFLLSLTLQFPTTLAWCCFSGVKVLSLHSSRPKTFSITCQEFLASMKLVHSMHSMTEVYSTTLVYSVTLVYTLTLLFAVSRHTIVWRWEGRDKSLRLYAMY